MKHKKQFKKESFGEFMDNALNGYKNKMDLEIKLKMAIKALEFYAKVYNDPEYQETPMSNYVDVMVDDGCGDTARTALKSLRGKE